MATPDLDIAAVLEHYGADVSRVSTVGWRPVRCPFHDDRNASASVNLNLGGFRCHACDVKGDAVSLIKQREGLDYRGAVAFAQEVLGKSVTGVRGSANGAQPKRPSRWRERLFS
jgi:DNA primase